MQVDKRFCASSYLSFRMIADEEKTFAEGVKPRLYKNNFEKTLIKDDRELEQSLKQQVEDVVKNKRAALALSGGIDSAILAKFMPESSKAYTFQCIVPGMEVANEVPQAQKYAKECNLVQEVVEIYWEDFEKYAPILMKHKGAPIHSIEVQIYKAAKKAKEDGYEAIIFGESADANYGGHSGLMSKDWKLGEFIDRFNYVKPYYVLKESEWITQPFLEYEKDGYIDSFEFVRNFYLRESVGSYVNACECAGIELIMPYVNTKLAGNLDFARIRAGENKYVVRDLFLRLYPGYEIPDKLPMPRATNEWFRNWKGPVREEFLPHCIDEMTGDQKWLVWALEQFYEMLDKNNVDK